MQWLEEGGGGGGGEHRAETQVLNRNTARSPTIGALSYTPVYIGLVSMDMNAGL